MADEKKPEQQPENPAGEETREQQPTEDFAGYGSLEEMRKGIYESRKAGKRQDAMIQHLTMQLAALAAPPPARTPMDDLNDLGIPVQSLEQLVDQRVEQKLNRTVAPQQFTQVAIGKLRSTHPSFSKNEADFNRWLGANEDVASNFNEAVTESPKSAELLLRGVYDEYLSARRPSNAEPTKVPPGAKLPRTGGSGEPRKEPSEKLSKDEMTELLKDARRTGDPVAIMRALIGNRPIHRDIEAAKGN